MTLALVLGLNAGRALAGLGFLLAAASLPAAVPEHEVAGGAVHLQGVGPDNPIVYDNDWWFDVFDNNYLWAQTSLGEARLRGNIVSRDMWDWQKGYQYTFEQSWKDAGSVSVSRCEPWRKPGVRSPLGGMDAGVDADRLLQRELRPGGVPGEEMFERRALA